MYNATGVVAIGHATSNYGTSDSSNKITNLDLTLIDKNGDQQPAWYLHRDFLRKANRFVEEYEKKHGEPPGQATYNRAAASWLKALNERTAEKK